MLRSLDTALEALNEAILADSFAGVVMDDKGYFLQSSLSHCAMWASQMENFAAGCKSMYLRKCVGILKELSSELESAVPRFDFVFLAGRLALAVLASMRLWPETEC